MRCGALLEKALEVSEHGDVSFRFEDGRSPLTGHRAVLCAASEEYAGLFRSGMVEGQEGVIGVPPGISEAGYRGLLEWAYLGECLCTCVCVFACVRVCVRACVRVCVCCLACLVVCLCFDPVKGACATG